MPFPFCPAGSRRAVFVGVVFAALLAPTAHAAEKKTAPPPGPKTPILTPEQLRDCLTQKDKLARGTDAAVKSKNAVAADKAEIDRSGAALEEEAKTLDRTSDEAVSAFNAKIIERNGRVDAWKTKAEAYNVEAENVLAAKDAYEKACANRRYDDRDLSDLQKKK